MESSRASVLATRGSEGEKRRKRVVVAGGKMSGSQGFYSGARIGLVELWPSLVSVSVVGHMAQITRQCWEHRGVADQASGGSGAGCALGFGAWWLGPLGHVMSE